jgi:hypothetical protein
MNYEYGMRAVLSYLSYHPSHFPNENWKTTNNPSQYCRPQGLGPKMLLPEYEPRFLITQLRLSVRWPLTVGLLLSYSV